MQICLKYFFKIKNFCWRRQALASLIFLALAFSNVLAQTPQKSAPLEISSEQQELSQKLQTFQNIVIDLRGARGGNGDVAAGYMTALDLIQRLKYKRPITFVIESEDSPDAGKATGILAKLLGKPPVKDGQFIRGGQIQIRESSKIPISFPTTDLYLSFSNPSSELSQEQDLVVRYKNAGPSSIPQKIGGIPIDQNTVLISQTVLGSTDTSLAVVRHGSLSQKRPAAGLAHNEAGIYNDTVAANLKGQSPDEIRHYLASEIGHFSDKSIAKNLSGLVSSNTLAGSQLTLAYGTTRRPEVKEQFETYLKGLAEQAVQKHTSFTVIMGSDFSLEDIQSPELRQKIKLFSMSGALPSKAVTGEIQVVTTKAVPHRIFVGLMALSQTPPVVAGDGALSAAVTLGKPFVMTRVQWNAKNIENYSTRISEESNLTPDQRKVLVTIFPKSEENLNLNQAMSLEQKEIKDAFRATSDRMIKLTDSIITSADIARHWTSADKAKGIVVDPHAQFHFALAKARENPSYETLAALFKNDDVLAENTYRLSDEMSQISQSARTSEKMTNEQFHNLEKALVQTMSHSKNEGHLQEFIRLSSSLGMHSKETAEAVLKLMTSHYQTGESYSLQNSAVEFLRQEQVLKTIAGDPSLFHQLIQILKSPSNENLQVKLTALLEDWKKIKHSSIEKKISARCMLSALQSLAP